MVTEQSDTERVPSMLAVWQLRERVWRAGEDGYHLWPPRGGLFGTSFTYRASLCRVGSVGPPLRWYSVFCACRR